MARSTRDVLGEVLDVLRAVLGVSLTAAFGAMATAQPAYAARPAQIFALALTSSEDKIAPETVEHLKSLGITLVRRPVNQPLSQELLRLFHVVLLFDFRGLMMPYFHDTMPDGSMAQYFTRKRNIQELHRYVEAGGGLFFSPVVDDCGTAIAEALGPLLHPWGVSVSAATARDEAHSWTTYCWTTNIERHPVTEGVRRIYYPVIMSRWDDLYPTIPFELRDPRWKAVVRAMPGAVTARCLQYQTWYPVPSADNPPVLAAVAEIGKGRVALLSVHRFYTFTYPYATGVKWIGEFQTGDINGIFMERGDGENPSDGKRLLGNMLVWAAEGAAEAGLGDYTPEKYAAAPVPPMETVPRWLTGWYEGNEAQPIKVLIGARSGYSSGEGTIAEWAQAARATGYSILVMTEELADFKAERWPDYVAECKRASGPDLVVMPGLEITDAYDNRMLLFGQNNFPQPWMLSRDGKKMTEIQYLMLGFGMSCSAIARPTTCPLPHQLFKFFSGVVVYTYDAEGNLIDDGTQAYQAQIYNMSNPIPLVVHELRSPTQVARAATTGHQLYVMADTVENAAWYMRDGMSHFWETPVKYLVTSGPMIGGLSSASFVIEDDVPITDVRYYSMYNLLRRWKPNVTRFEGQVVPPAGVLQTGFVWVQDQQGRTALSPPLRTGDSGAYNWRCSDRQNFFSVAVNYTGTILSDGVDIFLPTFGTDEGKGLWPHMVDGRRGENMAPLLEFPYFSPVLTVAGAILDQRYWRALWEEVVFDAKAPQGTSRSRVYEGRVRWYDLHRRPYGQRSNETIPYMLMEIVLRLRQPAVPTGDIFPAFVKVEPQPTCIVKDQSGAWVTQKLTEGYLDLPAGGQAADLVVLSPGLRVRADGWVGFVPPANDTALPAGHEWRAQWVRLDPKTDYAEQRRFMGLEGPPPFVITLSRGKLGKLAYVAQMTAQDWGVAGDVEPYPQMPMPLTLRIAGLNWNWSCGVWRPGQEPEIVPFGVFEGEGWANLDVTKGGSFYAGNLLMADDPRLRLALIEWTPERIALEVNNPTDGIIEATVRTPAEITGRYPLSEKLAIAPGTSERLTFPRG
ncbi:MAG: hypothetical protein N2512_11130 [Armatimonadetes bacterium]|nr:hypothetical protein [Armatimonadota bacterium]